MRTYRSLFWKALQLAVGQRVIIQHVGDGYLDVSGTNEIVYQMILDDVGYDASGRLRLHPGSQLRESGAQFILVQ